MATEIIEAMLAGPVPVLITGLFALVIALLTRQPKPRMVNERDAEREADWQLIRTLSRALADCMEQSAPDD